MAKVMVVTHKEVIGFPMRRYEEGNVILYSGGPQPFEELQDTSAIKNPDDYLKARNTADRVIAALRLGALKKSVLRDLPVVEKVFVYAGKNGRQSAMNLLRQVKEMGKEACILTCRCELKENNEFAKEVGIDIMMCGCGGRVECMKLVERYSEAPQQPQVVPRETIH